MRKLIFILLFVCGTLQIKAQQLELKDSIVVIIENGKEAKIDSAGIAQKIGMVRKNIAQEDAKLLMIAAKKAEVLELKAKQLEMLTYFLEIRNKYQKLVKKID